MSPKEAGILRVRILHLSDFHLSKKHRWDSDSVLSELSRTIRELSKTQMRPDVVAVTGDIGDKGSETDFVEAARWFEEGLLPALPGSFSRERLLLVPGNHDVHRPATETPAVRAMQDLLLNRKEGVDQQVVADVLEDQTSRKIMLARLARYMTFASSYGCVRPTATVPWWSSILPVDGCRILFGGLCTAWMSCSDQDYGKLLLGRWQVHQALGVTKTGRESCDLAVAMMHHPWGYFPDSDSDEVESIVHSRFDIVLRGHRHRQRTRAIYYPSRACLELEGGTCYSGSRYPNAFQLVEVMPAEGMAHVHYWVWDQQGQPWIKDKNIYSDEPDGIGKFLFRGPRDSRGRKKQTAHRIRRYSR